MVGVNCTNDGSSIEVQYAVDGKVVSITPPAGDFKITVTMGSRYLVTVDLPDGGYDDNRLFGFDAVDGRVIEGGDRGNYSFLVKGEAADEGEKQGSLDLILPTDFGGRILKFSLWEEGFGYLGGAYRTAADNRITIPGIKSDVTYSLYVNVEWHVVTEKNPGFAFEVEHQMGPRPGAGTSGPANDYTVRTGDMILLKLGENYQFDSSFRYDGVTIDSDVQNYDRVFKVLGGKDVRFSKAVLQNGLLTVVMEFTDNGSPLASFKVYGSAKVISGGSVVQILGGNPNGIVTDSNGKLSFVIDGAQSGNVYKMETGFAGFRPSENELTETVGDVSQEPSQQWIIVMNAVDVTMRFYDPDNRILRDHDWRVTSSSPLVDICPDAEAYPAWVAYDATKNTYSGLIGPEDVPEVVDFGIQEFYGEGWEPSLKAVPHIEDLTGPDYLHQVMILLNENELNGRHPVPVDFEFSNTLTIDETEVTCSIADGVLTITGCPEGTGALEFRGMNAVVIVVVISDLEDIS